MGRAAGSVAAVAVWAVLAVGCWRPPPQGPMPPGASWCGNWDTNFGPLTIDCSAGGIQGTYQMRQSTGTISGVMDGNYLSFQWWEGTQSGRGVLVMEPDGLAFRGTWGYAALNDGGWWSGYRLP